MLCKVPVDRLVMPGECLMSLEIKPGTQCLLLDGWKYAEKKNTMVTECALKRHYSGLANGQFEDPLRP